MKKTSLLLVVLLMAFVGANSQVAPGLVFNKKSSAVNVGIGFGNTIYTGSYYNVGIPTISASYEHGIVEIPMGSSLTGVVSAGGFFGVGFANYSNSFYYGYKVKTTYFLAAARANYHFIFMDKFDPYAGIILGYYFGNSKTTYPSGYTSGYYPAVSSGGFHGGVYAGARWFFTPAFAAFAELGWGMSIITLGATLKF